MTRQNINMPDRYIDRRSYSHETSTGRAIRISVLLLLLSGALLGGCSADADDASSRAAISDSTTAQDSSSPRVVSLGGSITECIYALGAGDRLVGVDVTSVYPQEATKLPKVGYQRTVSAENVLSLRPTLVLATEESGPATAIQQIRDAGVRVEIVPSEHSAAGARLKLQAIARALRREAEGEKLREALDTSLARAEAMRAGFSGTPRVLFIYARGAGSLQVSGRATAADAMIALAGGANAITAYEGYKPLTPEAAVDARPDILLLTTTGLEGVGGVDGLLQLAPALALTPAGKSRRVAVIDDQLLLGFGPRLGQGVTELMRRLHTTGMAGGR